MQSVIQILRRAGSVSLSRARHTSGNRGEEPDGKDERRYFVGHFGGRHHRFSRLVERENCPAARFRRVLLVRSSHDQSTITRG